MPRTDEQIVREANELARRFYAALGYEVMEGYRFDQARHPQEQSMWTMACEAYDFIDGTDVNGALACLED